MTSFLQHASLFYYYRLHVRIVPLRDTRIDGWLGAVLRNNFLFAAEKIQVKESGLSLRETLGLFPLQESHSLYKELRNGFPAPYVFMLESHCDIYNPVVFLPQGQAIDFSISLAGTTRQYCSYLLQALQKMCERGFGSPVQPFSLIEVSECSGKSCPRILFAGNRSISEELHCPVFLQDFLDGDCPETNIIKIFYDTPVSLFKIKGKQNRDASFQDKMNGFPSFYQLIRSLTNRLHKLSVLYSAREEMPESKDLDNDIEAYMEKAARAILMEADIRYITLNSTPKKEKEGRIMFSGYVGELVFSGTFGDYLPLLYFMQGIGVGNEVVYGMGRYKVETL